MRAILSFFGAIFTFATLGVLFGAGMLAVVFMIYGQDLPNHETVLNYAPPTISRIYSNEGRIIDEFAHERRLYTPPDEIPALVKQAFISAEDKNFYHHRGFDPVAIASAVLTYVEGGRLRGASTITQQVAKNMYLSGDRKLARKIKEIILAVRIEGILTKDQILGLYLNEIDLGERSFGVTAAAQSYFNKPLEDLDAAEAAFLAIHPKAPYGYDLKTNYKGALDRRNYVLNQMHQNGYLDDARWKEALAEPIRTVQTGDYDSFRSEMPRRDYFTDEIRRQLSRNFGEDEFFNGGLSIRATIDPALQKKAAEALRIGLYEYDRKEGVWRGSGETLPADVLGDPAKWRPALAAAKVPRDIEGWVPAVVLGIKGKDARVGIEGVDEPADGNWIPGSDVTWAAPLDANGKRQKKARGVGDLLAPGDVVLVTAALNKDGDFDHWSLRQVPKVEGAFMAMDVNTGRVLAMQGGFSYEASVFNRATQATRQPGSVFKPFVYAAALDSGYTPATIIVDAPIELDTGDGGVWRPQNASNKYYGPTPMRTGLVWSRNVMTIRLAESIGMPLIAGYAERFGVYDQLAPYLANALGSQETTLFKLVGAYAMFANGGERVEPTLVDRVQDRWGRTVYRHDRRICTDCSNPDLVGGISPGIVSNRERVLDPVTAYQITSMLEGVVQMGTASATVHLPVPVAGKTGTTNQARDAWFIGFDSNIVAGCYIGFDTPKPLGRGASGGALCGPVFTRFMDSAIKEYGASDFQVPDGGHFINIDRYSGERLASDATGDYVQSEFFRDGQEPTFGIGAMIDGGVAMGSNLPLFKRGEGDVDQADMMTTATGEVKKIPKKASFGSLSSGGLY